MSSVVSLGRLERVDLREAWPHEAGNFTPWLAQPENLTLLGTTLGIELEFEAIEKPVDAFSADILAKDIASDRWVLIENQLEQTDHTHLGQILTYAAGLDAQTIVWIAKDFREPHRAAIDYLNHISAPEFNFFGIQIELLKIGSSAFAPRFNVVAKPNDWSRQVSAKAAGTSAVSSRGESWQTYWRPFMESAEGLGLSIATRTPPKEGWCRIRQLKSGNPNAAAWVHCGSSRLRALIWLQGADRLELFDALQIKATEIEATAGEAFYWERAESLKSSFFGIQTDDGADMGDEHAQHVWFAEKIAKLISAVQPVLASAGWSTGSD